MPTEWWTQQRAAPPTFCFFFLFLFFVILSRIKLEILRLAERGTRRWLQGSASRGCTEQIWQWQSIIMTVDMTPPATHDPYLAFTHLTDFLKCHWPHAAFFILTSIFQQKFKSIWARKEKCFTEFCIFQNRKIVENYFLTFCASSFALHQTWSLTHCLFYSIFHLSDVCKHYIASVLWIVLYVPFNLCVFCCYLDHLCLY